MRTEVWSSSACGPRIESSLNYFSVKMSCRIVALIHSSWDIPKAPPSTPSSQAIYMHYTAVKDKRNV